MNNPLLKILCLIIIFIGCKHPTNKDTIETKSIFNLLKDYTDFQEKMTELDTLIIWINLSVCTYQGIEKLIVSKRNDSLSIVPEFRESAFAEKEFVKHQPVKISVRDTIWKFGEFLRQNSYRIDQDENSRVTLQLLYRSEKLNFHTNGLADLNRLHHEYYLTMLRLNPDFTHYAYEEVYEDLEVIEDLTGVNK